MKLSVYIIAYNQVDKIADAIHSVAWADEVVVVDSHSTDGTTELAERLGARVEQVTFSGFGDLRNRAIAACRHEWIFSLDSDERCTHAARVAIEQAMHAATHDVYYVPRRNYFMGKKIRYSGWYPDYRQPQLFRRHALVFAEDAVHERYEVVSSRPPGYLTASIIQIPFHDFAEMLAKANRYSSLGVARVNKKYSVVTMGKAWRKAFWSFIKHYFLRRGCLDGWAGLMIATGNAYGTLYRYAKCYEQQQSWDYHDAEDQIKVGGGHE